MDTLAFGYILPTTGRIPDLHRLETCAAGRTPKKANRTRLAFFSLKFNFPLKPSSAQECRSGPNPIPIRAAGSGLRLIRLPIRQQSGSK